MDIRDREADAEFRGRLREWLETNLPQEWRRPEFWSRVSEDESFDLRRGWEAQKAQAGWSGIDWPREYGGYGGTPVQKAIHDEELGRVRAPASVNRPGLVFFAPTVMAIGTEEQKRDLVRPILMTEVMWCQGFSEPEAGSDLAGLRTSAEDDGDHWVLNGQKIWTSNARYADKMFCLARTSREDKPHRGISMLLFDMDLPGIDVRPIRQISGGRDFGEVFFTDVRVPKDSVLGPVGDGWNVAMLLLSFERGSSAVEKYAEFRPELEDLVRLAGTLPKEGAVAANDPVVRQRIAQLVIEMEALRLHGLHVLTRVEEGHDLGPESSVTKLQWSETHQDMYELYTDLVGGDSVIGDVTTTLRIRSMQQRWFWSLAETIYGGSSQVQRNIVAERILGLPR